MRANRSASLHDAIGEPLHDRDVVGRGGGGHRLGEQAERADRRFQLVTDVGDEVAAHALDPPGLGDIPGKCHRADDLAVAAQRERAQLQHLTGRTVQRKFPFGAVTGERFLHELGDRFLGQHLTGTGAGEAPGDGVAHDLPPDAIDDHDRVARLVERGEQPVLDRLRLQHAVFRFPVLLGDRVDQREIVGDVDGAADQREVPPGVHQFPHNDDQTDPPDQTDDGDECRHDRGPVRRFIRIDL